jgi:hypothetical protein
MATNMKVTDRATSTSISPNHIRGRCMHRVHMQTNDEP